TFYSDIIEFESLIIDLNALDLEEDEKKHLIELAESNLHHAIIDSILSELNEDEKKVFLAHLGSDDHDRIWKLLNERVKNIEEKIKKTADTLKSELKKDIEDIKKLE
ncbi:MAG: hypothetical protein M1524_00425, partial [Patescibacteria group bacterium]|nr:hypothetical protein [Patescibacteria group bacterium]